MSETREFSRIEVEASEWLVAMSDRSVLLEDRARFEAWLAADAEHARVYRAQKSAWGAVAGMPHLLEELDAHSIREVATQPRDAANQGTHRKRVRDAALAACVLAMLAAGVVFYRGGFDFGASREFATKVAQVKDITLKDGTVVTLGAASRIRTAFTENARRVALTGGEAFFEVARDTARPFVVTVGDTSIKVLGTKFDVHYGARAVRVAVLEGRVQVEHGETPRILTAGETILASRAQRLSAPKRIDAPDVAAWRSGRLVYVDALLRDVIADVNRYHEGEIALADDRVGDMRFTAAFRADQIDRMLEILTTALPLEAQRPEPGRIVLTAKRN